MGWSPAALAAASAELGVDTQQIATLYPDNIDGVITRFSRHIDALMSDSLAHQDLAALRIRDRVKTAILTRLRILSPYRQVARNLLTMEISRPRRAALMTRLLAWTVDDIWHAAGDQSTGFSHYSKRVTLGLIYGSTILFWFQDRSPENTRTAAFLEQRIDDLMQVGKKLNPRFITESLCLKMPRWARMDMKHRSESQFKNRPENRR